MTIDKGYFFGIETPKGNTPNRIFLNSSLSLIEWNINDEVKGYFRERKIPLAFISLYSIELDDED